MSAHASKISILILFLCIASAPLWLRPAVVTHNAAEDRLADRLVIYTPNNEQIRYEVDRAFNAFREASGQSRVTFDWRASGGTSDLRRSILSQFASKASQGRIDEGIGADLFFGGGEYDHQKLVQGVAVPGKDSSARLSVSVPAGLSEMQLRAAFPEPTIGGERLYEPDQRWIGTALSSFGIVYNRDVLAMIGQPEPTTWSDLAAPAYRGWVALADPGHSGSIAATFDTVLRRRGWDAGWSILRRCFANARYFASSASKVPVDVSAGEAAAGMCIDFYGRFQAGAVAENGVSRVGYADPLVDGKSMTATTADPISILLGAPHETLAREFVAWIISPEGQLIWQQAVSQASGQRYELRRQPIVRGLYLQDLSDWTDPDIDPFATASEMGAGIPSFFSLVSSVSHAMAIDVHDDLRSAWEVICQTPVSDPIHARMVNLFNAMPTDLQVPWPDTGPKLNWFEVLANTDHPRHREAADAVSQFVGRLSTRSEEQRLKDQLRWTLFFQQQYRQVVELSSGR